MQWCLVRCVTESVKGFLAGRSKKQCRSINIPKKAKEVQLFLQSVSGKNDPLQLLLPNLLPLLLLPLLLLLLLLR